MKTNSIYKQAGMMAIILLSLFVASSLSHGVVVLGIAVTGVIAAFRKRFGLAICSYITITSMIVLNPFVFPKTGALWGIALRFGPLCIGMALALSASGTAGRHRLPLGMIFPFLCAACISAAVGWAPKISYLKIVNYTVFILGVWLGTQNMHRRPKDIIQIRAMFLGLTCFVVLGSVVLIPFPSYSYATSVRAALAEGDMAAADMVIREMLAGGDQTLFCGILNHSQSLAPILALSFAWIACDMIFVEKKLKVPHLVLMLLILPMLFMTRSRVAFVTFVASCLTIYFYGMRKMVTSQKIKRKMASGMLCCGILLVIAAGIGQAKAQMISKWLRKNNDVQGDDRALTEAMTSSRQGLIEQSMYEFHRNPLFGSGFQVAWYHEQLNNQDGLILSASIEKGVLPTMVLGETGLIGSFFFICFIVSFYVTATRRHLYVTNTLFTLLLVSNLGEASFFSPGGIGSVLYVLTIVGGFMIDTVLIYEKQLQEMIPEMFFFTPAPNMIEVRR